MFHHSEERTTSIWCWNQRNRFMFYNGMSKGSKSARNNCRFVFMVCIQLISENYALKKDLQLVKVENTFNRCGISPLASKGDLLILLEMGMAVASCQVYLSFTRNCLIDFVKKIVFYSLSGRTFMFFLSWAAFFVFSSFQTNIIISNPYSPSQKLKWLFFTHLVLQWPE